MSIAQATAATGAAMAATTAAGETPAHTLPVAAAAA